MQQATTACVACDGNGEYYHDHVRYMCGDCDGYGYTPHPERTRKQPASITRGLYRHFKGGLYVVIGSVIDATNGADAREMVLYVSCVNGKMFARARTEFEERVLAPANAVDETPNVPGPAPIPRFALLVAA